MLWGQNPTGCDLSKTSMSGEKLSKVVQAFSITLLVSSQNDELWKVFNDVIKVFIILFLILMIAT
ncbi:hypothetical protein HanXRQr2_Chr14g0635321 [Helianthus annuus]|uniref:Uncharacterized protein n=1 Tax=Helianthus annuus TaxID=4232 RepID=A0A9K3H5K1_HELAN|nr:hypothetical protein HanXRQr2_Chr14g0635321 [Helianthus annuus]KAJ0467806.1 hypothetical protein HanIR_Chr14g0689371 [Helianthus annuus]KAJ0839642.1 hypothetical protein HanPSC8_Chr14g0609281 [Helianthus annuus]